ncbi:MAG: class I SAM-dependent methyltransferase [Pseudomonadota bacterium]
MPGGEGTAPSEAAIGTDGGILAQACRAYLDGRTDAALRVERDDGYWDTQPVAFYFAAEPQPLEAAVLDRAKDRIVDVGCGAGRHVLRLQQAGRDAAGIELDPALVTLCRERGCRDVFAGDVLSGELGEDAWDTALLFGNSLGLGGTAAGTATLLANLRRAVRAGGAVLLTSVDVEETERPEHIAYHAARRAQGRPPGELGLRLGFDGAAGQWFHWHHLGPDELRPLAEAAGWRIDRVERSGKGPYAAILA